MPLNLYLPFRARNWHLLFYVKGCQWVCEPNLSPLLYKSRPILKELILVSQPNNDAKIGAESVKNKIIFGFIFKKSASTICNGICLAIF
jgi:hypothetical protein